MIRIPNDFFSVSFYTYMNGIHTCTHTYDIHILNPNETSRLMNHCSKSRPSLWTDEFFFWCIYFKITSLKQTQLSDTPKNLRYSEMFWKTRLFDRHQNLNVAWKLVHLIYKRIYIYNTERPKQNGVLGGDAAVMTGYT